MAKKSKSILGTLSGLEQLTGTDAGFVYAETPRAPMHIGSMAIYDPSTAPGGKVRFKEILNFVESRLHKTDTFRQKLQKVPLGVDHPYWVDDPDFDIEFHVRHIALPQPGDWRQLCIQAARLHSRQLDMSKPLWEFWVIEGLDNIPNIPKGSYAIVSKIHHAAIDGVSGVEIAQAVHTLTPEVEDIDAPRDFKRKRKNVSGIELLARAQVNAVTKPFHGIGVARRMAPGALKYLAGVRRGEFSLFGNKVPRTRFNGIVSGHRVVGGEMFDLQAIKDMRNAVPEATVNDVVLAIVGGALRRYLKSKDELPGESMIAMAPVSVRSANEKGAMGNEVSALSVALGTEIKNPISRLMFVNETTQKSKAMSNAIGARQLSDASKLAPAMVSGVAARLYTRLGLANRITPIFNTVVSNVPGPPVPIYMNGAKMVASYGLGPVLDGLGIFHAVTSYCGGIAVTFTADRKMISDPDHYAACLRESYDEMIAAGAKAAKKNKKKTDVAAPAKKAEKKKKPDAGGDDLTMINGVGPTLQKKLKANGVSTFRQIADLKDSDIEKLEAQLKFKGRIQRDKWIAQAQQLVAAKANGATASDATGTVH
ncbi:MAG: wax ester/triacylglycerol synthase family O-acyltransferase [Marinicaulis sp.]|nr:wax ester/triacylglycerol synthase family O-acyltransferase [Marinicaulis sp.]NNL90420.1 wax ester/triacylglycerol synthase family O-acyltransferase [Marinicaulis sp.]